MDHIVDLSRLGLMRRKANVITLADNARDAGQWELAAGLYRKALGRYPRNSGVWVQYGHALKESGELRDPDKLAQAETAYRKALSLDPGAADSHLQLGHVLKLQDKTGEARASYLRAFALDPSMPDPLQELGGLGWSNAQVAELRGMLVNGSLSENCRPVSEQAWSGYFDAEWYLEQNEDVARAGIDPLEHFLTYGLKEGRKPYAAAVVTGSWRVVTDADIRCLKKPLLRDEVALFATYSPHGELKPHVPHYLESLKRQKISVILIVNTDKPSEAANINFANAVDGVFVRQAEGYDFAAWAHILRLHPELFEAKILYLLNDSLIGPTNDAAFGDLLTQLRNTDADLIGLTENFERGWHLQSYFLALKPRTLSSTTFRKFIDDIVSYKDKRDVINEFEIRLAPVLKAAGLDCQTMFRTPDYRNPTCNHWKHLLQSGFPFAKVETIRGVIPDVDISDWRELLAAQGYDVSLAERTIAEFSVLDSPEAGQAEVHRQKPNSTEGKQGWKPKAGEGRSRFTAVTDAEIRCLKKPLLRDEVALFVTYSPHGAVKPHVPHYLESLKQQGISVILIVNTDNPSEAAEGNFGCELDGVFIRRNEGYDFAAWAHILRLHLELFEAKILYLLNDSLIGPTNDAAFGDLLTQLRNTDADLIGLTENFERGWHLQSYFLALKPRALSSITFRKFIADIVSYEDKNDVISEFEIKLSPTLKAVGLECQPLFLAPDDRNPTLYYWKRLLRSGCPFVKVEAIRGFVPDLDISDWRELLAARGYDVSLAERTLAEITASSSSDQSLRARIEASGLFKPDVYLSLHGDLRVARRDGWEHFLEHGLAEGRQFTNSEVVARVLVRMDRELTEAQHRFQADAMQALTGAENSAIALFRERVIKIGVFCSTQGNFYMREIADLLAWGLQAHGIDAVQRDETASEDEPFDLRVFVAPHEFFILGEGTSWVHLAEAGGSVLYNVEQVQTPWFCRTFELLLNAPLILDINFQSAEILRRAGCNVVHFMPGHLPEARYAKPYVDISQIELLKGYNSAQEPYNWLERNKIEDRPIDLLFVGTSAPRRDKALARIRDLADDYRFMCVYTRRDAPLTARNYRSTSSDINCALAQRAKIVLNIHRDWLGYFEWSRMVMHGFWQGACVLSDPGFPNPIFKAGVHYLEEDIRHLGELARWLLGTAEGREKLETTRMAGYDRALALGSMRVALAPVLEAFRCLVDRNSADQRGSAKTDESRSLATEKTDDRDLALGIPLSS